MVVIENEFLHAEINELGAELKSLKCGETQYIWQGSEEYWKGSSPIMFPICSGLKDDEYILDGKTYVLGKHGFARFEIFEVEKLSPSCVTFLLRSNEETLKKYPFEFEFRVTFALDEKQLSVKYDIKNLSGKEMYFSVGAHEGYYCPEGIEEYDIIFPQKETLVSTILEGNLLGYGEKTVLEDSDTFALKYDYLRIDERTNDALVFQNVKSKSVILKNRNSGKAVRVSFEGFPYLLLWTIRPGAPYICIEPWCGISDRTDTNKDIKTKQGINKLAKDESFVRTHYIEILK